MPIVRYLEIVCSNLYVCIKNNNNTESIIHFQIAIPYTRNVEIDFTLTRW